jgi:peroxiredoxin
VGSTAQARYSLRVLGVGQAAPDFAVGETTLHRILERASAVVFFFPKAFTSG